MKDLQDLFSNNPVPNLNVTTGGELFSRLLETAFYVAGFLAFFWMVWGAFQYIMASGKKEELQKARSRITYAIIGIAVVILAYFIMKYVSEILPTQTGGLPF